MTSQPPPLPAKRKRSAFATVMLVLGGGFLLFLLVAAVAFVLFLRSDTGKKVSGIMGEAMKMSKRSQNAPGTKELRAMGCAQAMVMTPEDFETIAAQLDAGRLDERDERGQRQSALHEIVICSVNLWSDPPPCDRVAAAYLGAVGPRPSPYLVTSQQAGKPNPACTVLYDADGTRLRDLSHDPAHEP